MCIITPPSLTPTVNDLARLLAFSSVYIRSGLAYGAFPLFDDTNILHLFYIPKLYIPFFSYLTLFIYIAIFYAVFEWFSVLFGHFWTKKIVRTSQPRLLFNQSNNNIINS